MFKKVAFSRDCPSWSAPIDPEAHWGPVSLAVLIIDNDKR